MPSKSQRSFLSEIEKKHRPQLNRIRVLIIVAVVLICLGITAIIIIKNDQHNKKAIINYDYIGADISYNGYSYKELNGNVPTFTNIDVDKTTPYESYSELDYLGRCGQAFAILCRETMPTGERTTIGHIKPSGWNQKKYPGVIESDPPYLYNRCHLIGFQLSGENANEKNLITGTRYFNVNGMLPWENKVKTYIDVTNNHVMYRVTPFYNEKCLVAYGVQIEAESVEDNGKGICFNVFVFNYQPGIEIDYSDGNSWIIDNNRS